MSNDSSDGSGVCFVQARLREARACKACGVPLARGAAAIVEMSDQGTALRVLCRGCQGPSATAASLAVACAPAGVEVAMPARGSLAVWIAVALLGVGAALGSRTGRRVLATGWVAAKSGARAASARVRGRRGAGPAIVRRAFEELGPTYVKLGQLIASSKGLFPERYSLELRKCLDDVPPFRYADVERILAAEIGRDGLASFAWIDPRPLASASIAQVHAARLKDGQEVVIKIRRPKIAALVEADLRVLRLGARAIELAPHGKLANPTGVVEDFASNIHAELDFRLEAESMREFNRIMALEGLSRVVAPRVLGAMSTRRVLVMERFFGHRVDDVDAIGGSPAQVEERLLTGMRAWMKGMIVHGFFHGDVHAGNLMALRDGRVGFLDFGIVGRFSRERREQVTDYLLAIATGDFRRLAEVMVAMGAADRSAVDLDRLTEGLGLAYAPMFADAAFPMKYADTIPTIMQTGVRYGLRMPREFVLLVKQMLYFDRYAKLLAPSLNVFRDPRIVAWLMEDVMTARSALAA